MKMFSCLKTKTVMFAWRKDGCKNLQRFSFKPLKPFCVSSEPGLITVLFIFSASDAGGLAVRLMLMLLRCAHDNNSNQEGNVVKLAIDSQWTGMNKKTARSTSWRSFMHDLVIWYEQEDKWVLCKVSIVLVSQPWF